jgi:hypothetical protein
MDKRTALFLFGCMGTRFTLTWLAKTYPQVVLTPLGIAALVISIGFMSIWAFGLRKTGAEVGGEIIWWNNLRPVHSILWALFAVFALSGDRRAWIILLCDTLLGLTAWTLKRM